MQTSQWTLLLASLMFIFSLWFVLSSAQQMAPAAAAATSAPGAEPIATVRELMTGLIGPASTTVYKSVSIVVDANGVTEFSPQNDEEWNAVIGAAAAVAEAGELLKVKGREGARDADPWRQYSQDMIDASLIARKAAQAHDKEGVLASGEALNDSCNGCHRAYDVE
jgi:hypothetical protein